MISYHPLFFGSECDNRCATCPVEDAERSRPTQALMAELDDLADCTNLAFTGGEPILHRGLLSLVAHARFRGARRIKIVTNGRGLADSNLLERLVEEGCRVFEVKVSGPTARLHDGETGVRGSFEETLQGLENLSDLAHCEPWEGSVLVTARVAVTRHNVDDLPSALGLLAAFAVDRIVFERRGNDLSITQGAQAVSNLLRTAALNRVWAMSQGFPPCLMQGCETHLAELLHPRLSQGKRFDPPCDQCLFREVCPGPPEAYVRERGIGEFRPITETPCVEDVKRLARALESR